MWLLTLITGYSVWAGWLRTLQRGLQIITWAESLLSAHCRVTVWAFLTSQKHQMRSSVHHFTASTSTENHLIIHPSIATSTCITHLCTWRMRQSIRGQHSERGHLQLNFSFVVDISVIIWWFLSATVSGNLTDYLHNPWFINKVAISNLHHKILDAANWTAGTSAESADVKRVEDLISYSIWQQKHDSSWMQSPLHDESGSSSWDDAALDFESDS